MATYQSKPCSHFSSPKTSAWKVKKLAPIAQELGCTMAQLAIAWCLSNEDVSTVITGASRPQQITENLAALKIAEQLTPDVQERIEVILGNRPGDEQNWRGM